jgi:hypothetical protein
MHTNARPQLNKLVAALVVITSMLSIAVAFMAAYLGAGVVYARF